MNRRITEGKAWNTILRPLLKERGFFTHKIADKFKKGFPDILAIKERLIEDEEGSDKAAMNLGVTYYIEHKVHPNKTTLLQDATLLRLAVTGAPVQIWTLHCKEDKSMVYIITHLIYDGTKLTTIKEEVWLR